MEWLSANTSCPLIALAAAESLLPVDRANAVNGLTPARSAGIPPKLCMPNLTSIEIKAFVPAKDFALCKQFYRDMGFELDWSTDVLAYFSHGRSTFLLQNYYVKAHAENFQMHLLVENVDDWWSHLQAALGKKYGLRIEAPSDKPWGLRDFPLLDPTGVCWRIGQPIEQSEAE